MEIEKLIADLQEISQKNSISLYKRDRCAAAATALSTLQAENAQLRESRDHWKRLAHELSEGVNGKDAEHERLQAENEKLRAELEQVKAERDAAVERIREGEKFDTYLFVHNFITPEKWRGPGKEN